MPKYNYPTIFRDTTSDSLYTTTLGKSNTSALQRLFAESPYNGYPDAKTFRAEKLKMLLSGIVDKNPQVGDVDLDYGKNLEDGSQLKPPSIMVGGTVPTGGGGLPASPWVPNPRSPGVGSVNPLDQAAAPEGYGTVPQSTLNPTSVASAGGNNVRNPAVASSRMSDGQEASSDASYSSLGSSPASSVSG